MRLRFLLPALLVLGITHPAMAAPPKSRSTVALFVSADVPKPVSFEVQRILRSRGIDFKAVRLRVKTDRTAVYSRETKGRLARRLSGWLGSIPIEAFDWDSPFEAVIYLARDYRAKPAQPRIVAQRVVRRGTSLGALVARLDHLGQGRPASISGEEGRRPRTALPAPDVLAWNDLLNRVEHLESRLRPELGQLVALVGSPLERTVEWSLGNPGWIKLQGQPIDPGNEEPVAELANATGPKQADRPVPLPPSRRIHIAGFLSILSPSAKTGQVFGQLLGPAIDVGFVWREPWIVQASMGYFSGSASLSRSDGRTDTSNLTRIPFGILVLFPLGGSEFARPFVGVGPAFQYQSLSNSAVFNPTNQGGDSKFGFGFELKGGAQFGLFRRLKWVTEVSWQAAEETLAGSREGSGIRFSLGIGF